MLSVTVSLCGWISHHSHHRPPRDMSGWYHQSYSHSHSHSHGGRSLNGHILPTSTYWKQATNMTAADQEEYNDLLQSESFIVKGAALKAPSNHQVYKDCDVQASWAKIHLPHGSLRKQGTEGPPRPPPERVHFAGGRRLHPKIPRVSPTHQVDQEEKEW